MTQTMYMPKLGMTMEQGTINRWFKQEGERIEKGEPLLEVETDKVDLEVEAPVSGRIERILAPAGATLAVMTPIAELAPDESDAANFSAAASLLFAGSGADQSPRHPSPQPDSGTIARAVTMAGDRSDTLDERKIAATPAARREARERGVSLAAVAARAQPPLTRADVLAFVAGEHAPVASDTATRRQPAPEKRVELTPLARKMAAEAGLTAADLAALVTGGGTVKITRDWLAGYLAARADRATGTGAGLAEPSVATAADAGALTPLTTMRRIIAERMAASFTTTPHIYLDLEVDMSEAERLRARRAQRGGPAISPTALLVKVAGVCLVRHPQVNASFVPGALDGKDAIRRHHGAHVGVAVAVEDGLLVPVVRDADRRDLADIAATIADLAARARAGKLRPDDLEGGTFSISNLGMYGIDTFHAIINPPQAAILAVGRITRRPVVVGDGTDERIEIRPMLKLSLSADHRVVDGATGAQFLAAIKELLEEPSLLV